MKKKQDLLLKLHLSYYKKGLNVWLNFTLIQSGVSFVCSTQDQSGFLLTLRVK